MNFDRVARIYRVLEHAVFGDALQRARVRWLGELGNPQRALVLGEGDGRFLVELAKAQPALEIVCLEASKEMIQQAGRRLSAASAGETRVRFIHEDVLRWKPEQTYDLVVTHFFLDCFEEKELEAIIEKIRTALSTDGIWLLADFAIPASGWRNLYGRVLVSIMYFFFRIVAGLRTSQLVDPTPFLRAEGFVLEREEFIMSGILKSQLWRRGKASG